MTTRDRWLRRSTVLSLLGFLAIVALGISHPRLPGDSTVASATDPYGYDSARLASSVEASRMERGSLVAVHRQVRSASLQLESSSLAVTGVAAETATAGGRSVDEVLNSLPKGKQSFVRTVPDEQTLQSTFEELTRGGTPRTWKNYNGQVFQLQDGTQIGMRGTSSSGGSTIDIRIPGQDPFKIHIG